MRHQGSLELFEYWNRQRGNRAVPTRNAIEPADIRRILPDLFIIQKTTNNEILFRLAGTQLCTLFGQELRGLEFLSVWEKSSLHHISAITDEVLSTAKPAFLQATTQQSNLSQAEIEVVILPLASESQRIDRALGCIINLNQTSVFLNNPIGKLTLDTVRLGWEEPAYPVDDEAFELQFKDGIDRSKQNAFGMFFRKVMHLRVFEGGRSG